MNFLKDLNTAQLAAATHIDGPAMIIAGAGSGKTRVLTYRLAYLISEKKAKPYQLLALTFTNKAATEMRHRIEQLVGKDAHQIYMGTFHSIFAKFLRQDCEVIGYKRDFSIYDDDDSISLIKQIMKELQISIEEVKPRAFKEVISHCKNYLISPEEYTSSINKYDPFQINAASVYTLYNQTCKNINVMDFDDILVNMVELLKYPYYLEKYGHKFMYVMIDEYQDTNRAQAEAIRLLCDMHQNICVVGDDAQSIYSFRGADIENILQFEVQYPDRKLFKLEENYRSTRIIVEAANMLISKNTKQIPKTLFTNNEFGNLILLKKNKTDMSEAYYVVNSIKKEKNIPYTDYCILYRTNSQSRLFEELLIRNMIPYKIFGGISFYNRKEIKDILSYIRVAANPGDNEALKRIINYPARSIGYTTLDKITEYASANKMSIWTAITNNLYEIGLKKAEKHIQGFISLIKNIQTQLEESATEGIEYIYDITGIKKDLESDQSQEGKDRIENVKELINAAAHFNGKLIDYLHDIMLLTDTDKNSEEKKEFVSLMTIHAAKGLEFNRVFLTGLEDGIFPSAFAKTEEEIEEERRLFYVACTRARKELCITYSEIRFKYGRPQEQAPSLFLEDIDPLFFNKI